MNKRENAMRILKFDHPAYVMTGMPLHMIQYLGCNHEGFDGIGDDNSPVDAKWTDIWGIGWQKKQEGIMGYPQIHPLSEVSDLSNYIWPDPNDERICKQIYDMAENRTDMDTFLGCSHRNLLMEKAEKLIGMENLMLYFYTEPAFVKEVFHKYMDFQLGIAAHYLKLGVEVVSFSEDLGSQTSLLVGPNIMSKFLLPEYERLFRLYREKKVIIQFHSCGHIEPMLDMLMDLGVDILNPIQVTSNNLEVIREKTMGRMSLSGGINSDTIINGPLEKIEAEVRERLVQLGEKGGYFCSADQHMNYKKENLDAMYQAIDRYGRYPLLNCI